MSHPLTLFLEMEDALLISCCLLSSSGKRTEAPSRFDPSDTVWFAVYYMVKQQSSIRYCDVRFTDFHGTMETTYQDLHKEGIKHAPIISGDKEVILWERKS